MQKHTIFGFLVFFFLISSTCMGGENTYLSTSGLSTEDWPFPDSTEPPPPERIDFDAEIFTKALLARFPQVVSDAQISRVSIVNRLPFGVLPSWHVWIKLRSENDRAIRFSVEPAFQVEHGMFFLKPYLVGGRGLKVYVGPASKRPDFARALGGLLGYVLTRPYLLELTFPPRLIQAIKYQVRELASLKSHVVPEDYPFLEKLFLDLTAVLTATPLHRTSMLDQAEVLNDLFLRYFLMQMRIDEIKKALGIPASTEITRPLALERCLSLSAGSHVAGALPPPKTE